MMKQFLETYSRAIFFDERVNKASQFAVLYYGGDYVEQTLTSDVRVAWADFR